MARARGDSQTGDLLGWERPELVERFDEERIRAASLRSKIARAVSETLTQAKGSRDQIAENMSEWLGEDVTKNMLDAYASQARDAHTIPYLRLLALVHVTEDSRLLQLGAEMFGRSVIENKFLSWVEFGQLADKRDAINKALNAARSRAVTGGRS